MFDSKHLRCRPLAYILASTWCASALATATAARPVEASELPATAAGDIPASTALIAAVAAPDSASPEDLGAPATAEGIGSADTAAGASTPEPVPASESVTVNLINRLVERGVLTKEDSADLMRQAERDAAAARAQAAAAQEAAVQVAVERAVAATQAQSFTPDPALMPAEDDVRVTYIPESVREQMRQEIKEDVLAHAQEERWVTAGSVPEWVSRIKLFGDVRVRYEGDYFPDGNAANGSFPNFNAINTGSPYDIAGTDFAPQLNVDQDRERIRLRARFGAAVDLGDGFTGGLRIATGENNSPVSTNQSLGLANQGQGGYFSKYAIWLDRAFLKYEAGGLPTKNFAITVGRFDNPFFSTEIVWDDDVGFDGAAVHGRYEVASGVVPFLTAGAFPVFNTDFNFSSNQTEKFESTDKWLYAVQIGTDLKIKKDVQLKLAMAYYHFDTVQGRLSDPFVPLSSRDAGNTDNTRPSFAQKGNTYFALRDIIPNELNNFGTINQFQYFGLSSEFRELALTGRLDFNRFEPVQISLSGEFVKNLGFDAGEISRLALNNRGPDGADGSIGGFDGGDIAWIVNLRAGAAALEKRWDWQVGVNYRYVESDAVVDGFTDSDFGGGGTNLKGYTLYGAVALSPRVSLGLRWMSASEIAGPQYEEDIIQIDINGKF